MQKCWVTNFSENKEAENTKKLDIKIMRRLSLTTFAVLALVMSGCNGKKGAQTTQTTKALVKTELTTKSDVEQIANFSGTIEPYVQNVISPATPVRIDDILVDVGARVKKGQLLVKMDKTQYRQAMVQLSNLETDYQRMKSVYEANGISKQQLDAQLAQTEVSREAARNLLENVELTSPINGVVTGRYYDAGDMFSMSPKDGVVGVLTVMQMDKLKIEINVSEQYFPYIKMGMPVDIDVDIYKDKHFKGKVTLIYPSIDPATRTFKVEITIPNADMVLRPGMFSRVTLNFGSQERVMMPDIALQRQLGTNETYVFVVKDGVAVRKTITVGRHIGDMYEILTGVELGDEVVTAGASKLMDGSEIEIIKK